MLCDCATFNIVPSFAGDYAHGYVLRSELVNPAAGEEAVLLHSSGYYVDGTSKLRIFLPQDEIRKRVPDFVLNRRYTMRATIILAIGTGGQAAKWIDAFIQRVFSERERSQSLDRKVRL